MDDISLVIGGHRISGWNGIRLTRGIERMPSDFDITMTDRYPGKAAAVVLRPGDVCEVMLGSDRVVTGYVDRFSPSLSSRNHTISVCGRGKCADLVDCSAEWPNGQISGASALEIAKKLGKPFGINVTAEGDIDWVRIKQFNLNWGETPFDVIERISRYSAVLAYDGTDGDLIMSRVGIRRHASGFLQGGNVQCAGATFSMDQRYSDYVVRTMSVSSFGETGQGGDIQAHLIDPGVPRHRLRYIISEANQPGLDIATQRGEWEKARRWGRSFAVRVTCDSWRDAAGQLWTPNWLAPISIPAVKLPDALWVISEVTFTRDLQGTRADLTLMPPEAFTPEPMLQNPLQNDVR
ncbi:MAG: phage baseplate assembly protein [Solirubrobacterales bacterium]